MRRFCCATLILLLLFISIHAEANAATQHLTVGVVANCPPYQFIDEDGQCTGLHIDLMDVLAEQMDFIVEYRVFDLKKDCDTALAEGEIDLILGVPLNNMTDTDWVTSEMTVGNICLLVENSIAESIRAGEDGFIGVYEAGTISTTLLMQINTHEIYAVGSQQEVLATGLSGKAQLMVGTKESLLYQMEQLGISDDYTLMNNSMHSLLYTMRVRENDRLLLRNLNRGISEIRASDVYEKLCEKWLVVESSNHLAEYLRIALIVFCVIIGAVLLYSLISTYLRSTLKKQVEAKTAELSHMGTLLEQQLTELKNESDFRNRIIRYSKLGMILFDTEYKIILINQSARDLISTNADVGDDVRTASVYKDILARHGDRIFTEKNDVWQDTIMLKNDTPDGDVREAHYRYILQPILKTDAVAGILLSVEDITEEELRKQQVFEAEKSASLNTLVAGLAHEIKNPLMAIRTFASVGAEGEMDPLFIDDFCRYVPSELDRINKLIESLISYATPSRADKSCFDIAEIIRECAFFANTIVDGSDLQIAFADSEPCMIYGNRDQVKQILINLIVNSVDSMKKKLKAGGASPPLHLTLQIKRQPSHVEIMIRDEGCGMTQEELARCRDPFFTTKKRGTGLGLTLCEQYMKEHHGKLLIDSVAGEHTVIRLIFRRRENETESIDYR